MAKIYAYEKWGGEEFGELILITDLFEEQKYSSVILKLY